MNNTRTNIILYIQLLLLILLFSCEKDKIQPDFRDQFTGTYCTDKFYSDIYQSYSSNLLLEITRADIDSTLNISIGSNTLMFKVRSDSSFNCIENYTILGHFVSDSIYIYIRTHTTLTIYKGKKTDNTASNYKSESVTDIEGNVYKTTNIKGKIWMTENIAVTKDKFGKDLPNSMYYNISEKCGNTYTFQVACEICPDGWRLPTKEDWNYLIKNYNISGNCILLKSIQEEFNTFFNFSTKCYFNHPFETVESNITNVFWTSSIEESNQVPFFVYFESYDDDLKILSYRLLCEDLNEDDKFFVRCVKDE